MLQAIRIATALALLATACTAKDDGRIGPEGGEVISDDGRLTVMIPEDALDGQVVVSVPESDYCLPDAVACYDVSPNGVMPDVPPLVTYEIDFSELDDPEDLAVYFLMDGKMVEAPDSMVDLEEGILSASIYYFGPVFIFAR